jgi:putative transposase
MSTRFYDTDLTDAAWAWVAPVLPAARQGGRPRNHQLSCRTPSFTSCGQAACGDYCHASFHRMARSTITFKPGKTPGGWVHLHRVLYEQARRDAGRPACPSVVIMDGQSVKTTERGGARGFDAHKRVKGR